MLQLKACCSLKQQAFNYKLEKHNMTAKARQYFSMLLKKEHLSRQAVLFDYMSFLLLIEEPRNIAVLYTWSQRKGT